MWGKDSKTAKTDSRKLWNAHVFCCANFRMQVSLAQSFLSLDDAGFIDSTEFIYAVSLKSRLFRFLFASSAVVSVSVLSRFHFFFKDPFSSDEMSLRLIDRVHTIITSKSGNSRQRISCLRLFSLVIQESNHTTLSTRLGSWSRLLLQVTKVHSLEYVTYLRFNLCFR